MSELRELYQAVILDHNQKPRNYGSLDDATHVAAGHNPLCGDQLKVYVHVAGDPHALSPHTVIDAIRFEGSGCAISKASASLMTSALKGKTVGEADALFEAFHALVTGEGEGEAGKLGKLSVFGGVREFPMRVKCATLSWHTVKSALSPAGVRGTDAGGGAVATTE